MKPRERRLLRFVQAYKATHDNAVPLLANVAAAVGIRNKPKVRRLIGTLIDRGRLATESVAEASGGYVPPASGGGSGGIGGGGGGGGEQN